jgi:hypothetical protein
MAPIGDKAKPPRSRASNSTAIRGGCQKTCRRPEKDNQRRDHGEIYVPATYRGDFDHFDQPLSAQGQQPDAAKLKADAQKVISIISGDKAKTQSYCQIAIVGEQMNEAAQAKDKKKFDSWLRS